jgi:hypothetical protein
MHTRNMFQEVPSIKLRLSSLNRFDPFKVQITVLSKMATTAFESFEIHCLCEYDVPDKGLMIALGKVIQL